MEDYDSGDDEYIELDPNRIHEIIAVMAGFYGRKFECVVDWGLKECYIFLGWKEKQLKVYYVEVLFLRDSGIIEFDSGSDEKGQETEVYVLTDEAEVRIKEILKNKIESIPKLKGGE
ncbi:MAG: hypothetical protein WCO58_01230 [bacterium]